MHTSEKTRNYLINLGIKVFFTAPYGVSISFFLNPSKYNVSPIEMLFSRMKATNLNPSIKPTGKKAFKTVVDLLQQRALQVSPATIIMLWRHVIVSWFDCLYFKRI